MLLLLLLLHFVAIKCSAGSPNLYDIAIITSYPINTIAMMYNKKK